MRLEITTESVPDRDRFALWRGTVFDTLAISAYPIPDATGPFRARFTARSAGPLLTCRFRSDGFHAVRQGREIVHRQWHGYRVYRESGPGVCFTIAGQPLRTVPDDLVIADADALFEAHPIAHYADESWLLPKALLDPHLPRRAGPLLMRLSGRTGVQALAASYLDALSRNLDAVPEPAMATCADTLVRLVGIACGAAAEAQPDALQSGRLVAAKRYIDLHLADPDLSPARVAAALGIAVRTLHMAFEPTGDSFARHVLRQRLDRCRAALLAHPDRPVIDIAFAWGFSSLSGFYRAFQAAFGMAPGDLRATASDGAPRQAPQGCP